MSSNGKITNKGWYLLSPTIDGSNAQQLANSLVSPNYAELHDTVYYYTDGSGAFITDPSNLIGWPNKKIFRNSIWTTTDVSAALSCKLGYWIYIKNISIIPVNIVSPVTGPINLIPIDSSGWYLLSPIVDGSNAYDMVNNVIYPNTATIHNKIYYYNGYTGSSTSACPPSLSGFTNNRKFYNNYWTTVDSTTPLCSNLGYWVYIKEITIVPKTAPSIIFNYSNNGIDASYALIPLPYETNKTAEYTIDISNGVVFTIKSVDYTDRFWISSSSLSINNGTPIIPIPTSLSTINTNVSIETSYNYVYTVTNRYDNTSILTIKLVIAAPIQRFEFIYLNTNTSFNDALIDAQNKGGEIAVPLSLPEQREMFDLVYNHSGPTPRAAWIGITYTNNPDSNPNKGDISKWVNYYTSNSLTLSYWYKGYESGTLYNEGSTGMKNNEYYCAITTHTDANSYPSTPDNPKPTADYSWFSFPSPYPHTHGYILDKNPPIYWTTISVEVLSSSTLINLINTNYSDISGQKWYDSSSNAVNALNKFQNSSYYSTISQPISISKLILCIYKIDTNPVDSNTEIKFSYISIPSSSNANANIDIGYDTKSISWFIVNKVYIVLQD